MNVFVLQTAADTLSQEVCQVVYDMTGGIGDRP